MEIWLKCYIFVFTLGVTITGQSLNDDHNTDNHSDLIIDCNERLPILISQNIKNVTLNCQSTILFSQFINKLNLTKLNSLRLNIAAATSNLKLNTSQFENLNVEYLVIDYKFKNETGTEELIEMPTDAIYVLNTVKELEITGVKMLPELNKVTSDNLNSCANLETLRLSTSDMRLISLGWLKVCKKLRTLIISKLRQRNGTKEIRRKILAGLSALRELRIQNCYIEELEDELTDLVNLEMLDVSHNQIHYALTTIVLPSLVELDLSHNHIFSSALLSSGVEKQPKLRVLSINYNTVLDICDELGYRTTVEDETPTWHKPLQGRSISMPAIERFYLRGTITTDMCFGNMRMDSLEYFDLSDSKITYLHFKAVPQTRTRRLEVNVSGCPIKEIPGESFTEEHYKLLRHEELRFTGLNVKLNCDCSEYIWLARAARERRLVLSGALCTNGQDLATIPEAQLNCIKYPCHGCLCRRYWQDNSTDMECTGELESLPKEPGLRRLNAAGNLLENITASDLPKSLIYLDLSSNHIARMSAEASVELFSVPNRTMRLLQNPIICDCDNKIFIQTMMDHYTQVLDYSNLQCIDGGRFIRDVDPSELCISSSRVFLAAIMGTLGGAIVIVAILVPLYCRYGNTVKVYLYSKGLFLFCIREDEIDADRPYDAFVSFSHKDELFVTNDLLPGLENEPYKYKICVHYRNWIAGELIPTQINISVEKSRRTIIVLSKNFLESVWGLLEFRTAHLSALKEGRARLIIIILDDILETGNLDGELKSYLNNNTYVRWGDPWFWNKVRYALPHKDVASQEAAENSGNRNKRNDEMKIDSNTIPSSGDPGYSGSTQQLITQSSIDTSTNMSRSSEINTSSISLNTKDMKTDDILSKDFAIEMVTY